MFNAAFEEFGLPVAIRTDNGPPFASPTVGGLSRLAVWWMRLGIAVERIEPGHPEQNGRHERMHRTLKEETALPPASSLRKQQRRFDAFRADFNHERPHEALAQTPPSDWYQRSTRPYPKTLPRPEYPPGFYSYLVPDNGVLPWRGFDEVPPMFAEQLQGMQPGDVIGPVRGGSGFHLLKLIDKREAGKQTVTEYKARGILVRNNELVTLEQARERIDAARARILAGEDFAEVAKEVSEDTLTRDAGGDFGWFKTMAYGTAVGEVVQNLADGEVSEPFRSDAGWHIIKREGVRETDVTEELLRQQARELISRRKAEEEWERFLRQTRAEACVETRLGS